MNLRSKGERELVDGGAAVEVELQAVAIFCRLKCLKQLAEAKIDCDRLKQK